MEFHSKEELKEYVHSIHNFIRNSGAGYGMTALKMFNLIYSLKLLKGKCKEIGLDEECDWDNIKKEMDENKKKGINSDSFIYDPINILRGYSVKKNGGKNPLDSVIEKLYNKVDDLLNKENIKKVEEIHQILELELKKLRGFNEETDQEKKIKNIVYFVYHQIQDKLDNKFLIELFNKVDNLPTSIQKKNEKDSKKLHYDLKGKIYEYFIGRDSSAIADLGAYFTDRHIIKFIIDFVKPKCDGDIVPSMIDPFAGSGGFTLGFVEYINTNNENIDWNFKDNFLNIHHYDMAEDVVKIAGVEFYSITNNFPNRGENFKRVNTFKNEFYEQKFKYIFANPPYGGDKGTKTPEIIKRELLIELNNKFKSDEINYFIDLLNITDIDDIETFKKSLISATNFIQKEIELFKITKYIENRIFKLTEEETKELKKFIEKKIKPFCSKNSINFDDLKNQEIFYKYYFLNLQNIVFKKINDAEIKKALEEKVNYDTCSNTIRNYAQNIYYEYSCFINDEKIKKIELEIENNNSLTAKQREQLSKSLTKEKKDKEILLKEKENEQIAKNKDMGFNDKESCSLILLMALLEKGGTCVGVLKEGVFFDGKYSKLRCYLINNFDVTDIISIDSKSFENTTTKTSVIIFKNTGKTKKIKFHELKVKTNPENIIEFCKYSGNNITKIKGEIIQDYKNEEGEDVKGVDAEFICSATYKQLSKVKLTYNAKNEPKYEFDYSLNAKDYIDYEVDCPDGFKLIKLGDICDFIDGYAFKTSDMINSGIPIIQISNINNYSIKSTSNDKFIEENKKYEKYLALDGDIIIGMTGNINQKISIYNNTIPKYINQRVCALRNFKNKHYKNYLYSYWLNMKIGDVIQNKSNGSVQANLSKNDLLNLEIPFPIDITDYEPVLNKIYKYHQKLITNIELIQQKENLICDTIKDITENQECDEVELGSMCEIKYGIRITKKKNIIGKYPVYGGGDITFYTNTYNRDKNTLIISRYALSKTCVRLLNHKFYLNDSGLSIHTKDKIFQLYINYYLLTEKNQEIIYKNCTYGSVQKNLNIDHLKKLKIKIPKDKKLIEDLELSFEEIETLQNETKEYENLYNKNIKELFKDFDNLESQTNETESNTEETQEETHQDNQEINETESNQEDNQQIESEDDEPLIISHKEKQYIVENEIMYLLKSNNTKGKAYGTYINGKVKKYPKQEV